MIDRIAYRPDEAARALGLGRDFIYRVLRTGSSELQGGRAELSPPMLCATTWSGR